jgi:hypothetical protein
MQAGNISERSVLYENSPRRFSSLNNNSPINLKVNNRDYMRKTIFSMKNGKPIEPYIGNLIFKLYLNFFIKSIAFFERKIG